MSIFSLKGWMRSSGGVRRHFGKAAERILRGVHFGGIGHGTLASISPVAGLITRAIPA